jgi:preprotein translocase subunit YajC
MSSQAWAHILIIVFIILGNVGYFMMRRTEKKEKRGIV